MLIEWLKVLKGHMNQFVYFYIKLRRTVIWIGLDENDKGLKFHSKKKLKAKNIKF